MADGAGVDDTVFVLDHDHCDPSRLQMPRRTRSSCETRDRLEWWAWHEFSDNRLEFGFLIWEARDCHACPSGGRVDGTYKVVKK